jgi:hypothetical protein
LIGAQRARGHEEISLDEMALPTLLQILPPSLARRLDRAMHSPPILVAAMLVVATLLAFTMALVGGVNDRPELWRGPPDEYGHRSAASYYVDHWLPPKVGEAASLDSYSRDYGYSYLNEQDLVYFFAGKFAALIAPVVTDRDVGFRLFNVLLLAILTGLCCRRPAAWLVFAPLLLSPQIWYVFSYFNGDAFPLFLSMLIAYQVSERGSVFNKYLDRPGLLRGIAGALLVGVLVALLGLSKKNYMAFLALLPAVIALARLGAASAVFLASSAIVSAAWYLGWFSIEGMGRHVVTAAVSLVVVGSIFVDPSTRRTRGMVLAKFATLGVIALAVVASRFAWDLATHGSLEEKRVAMGVVQEAMAKPEYKPSQIYGGKPEATYYGIGLRARAVPLRALFAPPWSWHTMTFVSATGQYGWLEFSAGKSYYAMIGAGYLALLAAYAWAAVRAREHAAGLTFLFVSAFAALCVAVAIHHSWVNDFQAQGRYLFPIAAMLGIGLQSVRNRLQPRVITGLVAGCFALSVWSFVFIGLAHIPRSF